MIGMSIHWIEIAGPLMQPSWKDGRDMLVSDGAKMAIGYWGRNEWREQRGDKVVKRKKDCWMSRMGPTPYEAEFPLEFEPTHVACLMLPGGELVRDAA